MKAKLIGFGDIAQRLAAKLLPGQWQVAGLRRHPVRAGGDVRVEAGDCTDPKILAAALTGQHVAVFTLSPDAFTEQAYRGSYLAAASALAAALGTGRCNPGYVIWVSSTSVYGEGSGEWVDEASPAAPNGFSGRVLLEAENIIRALPVPTTVVRFSGIYGPGRDHLLNLVRRGEIAPAIPQIWTNRIHSEDCAGVLQHLLERHRTGVPNPDLLLATDSCPAPAHEVQSWLAGKLQVDVVPGPAARLVRGNRRCRNGGLLATGYQLLYPDYRSGYQSLLSGL